MCAALFAEFLCLQHDAFQKGQRGEDNMDIVDYVLAAYTKHMIEPKVPKACLLVADGVYMQPFTLFLLRILQVCHLFPSLTLSKLETVPRSKRSFKEVKSNFPHAVWQAAVLRPVCNSLL
jgi:hypothetical protein